MFVIEILFYAAFLYQLVEVVSRGWAIGNYQRKESSSPDNNGFSVIICAHNELKNLTKNIDTVLAQDYPNFEVIVVLDRSNDGSFEFLETRFQEDPRLRVLTINTIPAEFHSKKYGITQAINLANMDWMILTDADCKPMSNQWIRSFDLLVEPKTALILGVSPYESYSGFLSKLVDFETFQTAFSYVSSALKGKPYMGVGRNLAYRKELFLSNDGFGEHKSVTGGDDDLFVQQHANALNTKINLNEFSLTKSEPKRKWKAYLSQKTRHLAAGKKYSPGIKIKLATSAVIHLTMWLSFIILVSFKPNPWIILTVFTLGIVIKGLIAKYTASKMQMSWHTYLFPLLDFVYAVLLPLVGFRSFLIKKVRWN